jgi:hypothetical protein
LRAYLRVGCNSTGVVVGCSGDEAGAELLQQIFDERFFGVREAICRGRCGNWFFGIAVRRAFTMFAGWQKISSRSKGVIPGT